MFMEEVSVMGSQVMCHFCCEYRECFEVTHKSGKEQFNMCFRCGLNYQGKEIWKEEREVQSV